MHCCEDTMALHGKVSDLTRQGVVTVFQTYVLLTDVYSGVQFNRDASSIAFLHHSSNCSSEHDDSQDQSSQSRGAAPDSVRLVTTNKDGQDLWVLPLDGILHYEYGRKGNMIVSTQHGLFEANTLKHTVEELKPPNTGWTFPCAFLSTLHCRLSNIVQVVTFQKHPHPVPCLICM